MGTHKGAHESIAKASSSAGLHDSCAGTHEPVAPVRISEFSSLFRAIFRRAIS